MATERLGNGLGDANGLSLPYSTLNCFKVSEFKIIHKDRTILRELAARVADLAKRPCEDEKKDLWYKHNNLEATRPLIFCDPENGWYEIVTKDQMKCEGDLAKLWEFRLRKEIFWGESMGDDRVIEPYFFVQYIYDETDWGMHQTIIGGENNGSYRWDSPLKDYNNFQDLHFRKITINYSKSKELFELAQETVGDLLKVKYDGCFWWSLGMTWDLANLRGMEQIMFDMYDYPDELHKLMAFLRDETLAKLDFLEANGLLTLNNEGNYVGSGGFGWTRELPQKDFDGKNVRASDMWGFSESQETIGVSPGMFGEFIFPYQLPILERFGLNCYGCCEPLDKRWYVINKIPRLRRVSVSAWANIKDMAEKLTNKYIYSWKPAPADLAYPNIDEAYIRSKIANTVKSTKDCRVEIIMKDNHTICGNPKNIINWCRIAREEAEAI